MTKQKRKLYVRVYHIIAGLKTTGLNFHFIAVSSCHLKNAINIFYNINAELNTKDLIKLALWQGETRKRLN
jgi:hypothetical protein